MRKIPPIAPTIARGPLGVVQLPRLWSKVLLDSKGLLPEGYSVCGQGFDRLLLEGLGLDRERTLRFLQENLPSYPQFEAFVREELGGAVPQEKIEAVNRAILGLEPPPERRRTMLAGAGFAEDAPARSYSDLNQLDDWAEFHRHLTGA